MGIADPPATGRQTYADRKETPAERLDRNYHELLQELRIAQTGVQILTAFLLALPFQQRFTILTASQRTLFTVIFICAASSVLLLVAPVTYHRLLFRQGKKAQVVSTTGVLALAGVSLFAVAITGAVLLITSVLYDGWVVVLCTAIVVAVVVTSWLVVPVLHRLRDPD